MKKFPISLFCGIAVIVLTVLLYFTILRNEVLEIIHFVTLAGVVLAEIITTLYALTSRSSPRKVLVTAVSTIMIPISVLLSVVYIVNFPDGYVTYLCWYSVATIAVNAFALSIGMFDARRRSEDKGLQSAKENMKALRKIVMCILAEPAAKPYENRLRAMEESLHFSNDCVIMPEDETIRQMLLQLESNINNPEFAIEPMLEKIEKTIKIRSICASRTV